MKISSNINSNIKYEFIPSPLGSRHGEAGDVLKLIGTDCPSNTDWLWFCTTSQTPDIHFICSSRQTKERHGLGWLSRCQGLLLMDPLLVITDWQGLLQVILTSAGLCNSPPGKCCQSLTCIPSMLIRRVLVTVKKISKLKHSTFSKPPRCNPGKREKIKKLRKEIS